MPLTQYGLTDWSEQNGRRPENKGENKTVFMRLEKGSNPVRIVMDPMRYLAHKYKAEEDKDPNSYGDWVKCSGPTHNNECPLCDIMFTDENGKLRHRFVQKKKWYVPIIDRKEKRYKLMDIGSGIYNGIKTLNDSEDWGEPRDYDISIVMDPTAPPANFYQVLGNPKGMKPLSDEDLAMVKTIDQNDILRRCTPPDPAWVLNRVNTIREKKGLPPMVPAVKTAAAIQATAPVQTVESSHDEVPDDDVFDFPPANV